MSKYSSDRIILASLVVGMVLAQADKHVLSLVAAPVQRAMGLSDFQIGMVQGLAFALVYALAGLPLGWLLDRATNRLRIVAVCVVVWSCATMASGLAGSFATLFALRALTAFAEAGLAPAAGSLISQMGNRRAVMRAGNFFMLAPYIGSGIALIGGGFILRALSGVADGAWRYTFLAMGLPGLLLAPILAWRLIERPKEAPPKPSPVLEKSRLFANWGGFFPYHCAGLTALYAALFGFMAWYPLFLVRAHGLVPATSGQAAGTVFLIAGIGGTVTANLMAKYRRDDSIAALARTFVGAATLAILCAAALSLSPVVTVSVLAYGGFAFFAAVVTSMMLAPVQITMPLNVQARTIAIMALFATGVGGTIGPLLIGAISDTEAFALRESLATVGCTSLALATVAFTISYRKLSGTGGA